MGNSDGEDPFEKLRRDRLEKMNKDQITNQENITKKVSENLEAKKLRLEKLNQDMGEEESFEVEIEESENRVLKEKFVKNIEGKKSINEKKSMNEKSLSISSNQK